MPYPTDKLTAGQKWSPESNKTLQPHFRCVDKGLKFHQLVPKRDCGPKRVNGGT